MKTLWVGIMALAMLFCVDVSTTTAQQSGDKSAEKKRDQKSRRGMRRDGKRKGRRGQRRPDNAPKVGDIAPVFTLKSLDGESETDIGSFNGEKPVVLFFGSYT